MEADLEELWTKSSISEEEKSEVVINKVWVEETENTRKNCLIGKVLTKRIINQEAIRTVFYKIWKLASWLTINEVGDKVFIFKFDDEYEKDKVLVKQPWLFNKSLLVLKEFDDYSSSKNFNLDWCPFLDPNL
ncbi:hypothetical protein CRYUN_Cryun24cG0108200 [Craigia yunnanensis]